MLASKSLIVLTSVVASAYGIIMDPGLSRLSNGMEMVGVVIRDLNGVESVVSYDKIAHMVPRQEASTVTVTNCAGSAPKPTTPVSGMPATTPMASMTGSVAPSMASSMASAPPAATTSASPSAPIPAGNAGAVTNANLAAAAVVGFAVAAFI